MQYFAAKGVTAEASLSPRARRFSFTIIAEDTRSGASGYVIVCGACHLIAVSSKAHSGSPAINADGASLRASVSTKELNSYSTTGCTSRQVLRVSLYPFVFVDADARAQQIKTLVRASFALPCNERFFSLNLLRAEGGACIDVV